MKFGFVGIIGVIALVLIASSIVRNTHNEPVAACPLDALLCPDGSSVGRVGPSCEFAPCPTPQEKNVTQNASTTDPMIRIDVPGTGSIITSPVTVSGTARGNWFFEGSAPVSIVNWDGLIIGEGFMTAQGEWMTTEFVPFTGTIAYTIDPNTPYDRGALIFKKDNPSGLPEHDDAREIPIRFGELISTDYTEPGSFPVEPTNPVEQVFCTMDAMMCPDGSYVGRVPPSCNFAPCQ